MDTILGRKVSMSQTFTDNGERIPVTLVEVGPCVVTRVKTLEKDGYKAVQLSLGGPRCLREVGLGDSEPKVGDEVKVGDVLKVGDVVSVSGVSKGKGFAGGVKRWGFHGGPKTHGQSDRHRAPGSIGQGTTPGRVHKGKKMAGRMGSEQKTVKNLKVISVNEEKSEALISGPIPGRKGSLVIIKKLRGGSSSAKVVEGKENDSQS